MVNNKYEFTVVLTGFGDDANAAWDDAVSQFAIEPGPAPDDPKIESIEED